MAITYDTGGTAYGASISTQTVTYTVGSGSNGIGMATVTTSGTITGVTWGGNAMTQVTSIGASSQMHYMYYITGIVAGSVNVIATASGTATIGMTANSFYGVAQSSPIDIFGSATGGGGVTTVSVTTTIDNDMLFDSTHVVGGSFSPTSGQTAAVTSGPGSYQDYTAYRLTTTAGSYTDAWSGSAALTPTQITAALKPISVRVLDMFPVILM